MKQREVQGSDNIKWSCVQAFTGIKGKLADEAVARMEKDGKAVEIICTPSGGEQTVRLQLSPEWMSSMPDQDLVVAIERARKS